MDTDVNAIDASWNDITGDITSLARAYFILERERAFPSLYWYMKQPAMSTLKEFLEYYHGYSTNRIYEVKKMGIIAAYFFIHDTVLPHHCHIGAFCRRRYWGEFPEEFGRMILPEIHKVLGVPRVYAFTPSRAAVSLAERIGMKFSGTIPRYAGGRDVYIFIG